MKTESDGAIEGSGWAADRSGSTPDPISAEERDLIAWRVGNAREARSACPLNRARRLARRLAAVIALLSRPCRAQIVGLDHRPVGRVGPGEPSAPGNAAHARRSGPSHHGCPQLLGLDGPVSVTAAG